jgi:hypothetical protein
MRLWSGSVVKMRWAFVRDMIRHVIVELITDDLKEGEMLCNGKT